MTPFKLIVATSLLVGAVPAAAGLTVLGSSSARLCYEKAEAQVMPRPDDLRRCDDALEREALSEYDRVATHVNRGILRMRLGKIDAAVDDFDRAIAIDPDEAEAYLNKGMASLRTENWVEALPLFDQALARETRRPAIAYYGRGVAHEMSGKVREAYYDYRQASALAPEWRDPQTELARFRVVAR